MTGHTGHVRVWYSKCHVLELFILGPCNHFIAEVPTHPHIVAGFLLVEYTIYCMFVCVPMLLCAGILVCVHTCLLFFLYSGVDYNS